MGAHGNDFGWRQERAPGSMLVGIGLPQRAGGLRPGPELAAQLGRLEAAGFHGAWVSDIPLAGLDAFDGMTMLAFAAAHTTRMRVGASALLLNYYQPVHLARMAATIDQLSGGRLDLGVTLGTRWHPHGAFGAPTTGRVARFEEFIGVLRALWTGESVDKSDGTIRLEHAIVRPRPFQDPFPLWLGGTAEPALQRVAVLGDGWMSSGATPPDEFASQLAALREMLAARGRDSERFPVVKRAYVAIDYTPAQIDAWFDALYDRPGSTPSGVVRGGVDDVVEQLLAFRAAGVPELIVDPIIGRDDQLDAIIERVLPALRDA